MDINLSSQIVVQTAAQWAVDATVYSNKRILVTSDVYYGSTDQRKFKIADGVQTWSNLDYMPIEQVTTSTIGSAINGATSATPNDTDLVMSVDTSVAKKNTWTQIKAFLKTYFDTVYQATGSYLTSANITQTITNGVTDKAPSEDAVYDALALKLGILNKTTSDQTTVTGSTSNVISYSFPISGNSVTVGDILMITARSRYVGTAGGKTIRWYVNTSDSLSGATLLATYAAPSNSLSTDLGRVLAVKSTTNSEIIGSGVTTLIGSESNSGTALSSISIDWTVTQYFIEAIQLSNGADSGVVSYSITRKA